MIHSNVVLGNAFIVLTYSDLSVVSLIRFQVILVRYSIHIGAIPESELILQSFSQCGDNVAFSVVCPRLTYIEIFHKLDWVTSP